MRKIEIYSHLCRLTDTSFHNKNIFIMQLIFLSFSFPPAFPLFSLPPSASVCLSVCLLYIYIMRKREIYAHL